MDEGHLEAVNLALELEDEIGKLDFLRVGFDEVTLLLLCIFVIASAFV